MIEKLKEMLRRHEGLRLTPYLCSASHRTIGYGHNLDAHGEEIPESITLEQAEQYLDQDIRDAIRSCASHIPDFARLDPIRQAVLIDMAFMGIGSLMEFKRMLAAIHLKQWGVAAVELLSSDYARTVKGRARELALMLLTGQWYDEGSREIVVPGPS